MGYRALSMMSASSCASASASDSANSRFINPILRWRQTDAQQHLIGIRWKEPLEWIKPINLEEVLQDVYDSEISVATSWVWDGGIDLGLGDELNGYVADGQVKAVAEAAAWLRDEACKQYPDSGFARKYCGFV
jgi:hypothetical protein